MSNLPGYVRRVPIVFYAAALIHFVGSVILTHVQIGSVLPPDGSDAYLGGVHLSAIISGWLYAFFGGLVLGGIGVLTRILIEICDGLRFGAGND